MTHRTIQRVHFPATGPFAAHAPMLTHLAGPSTIAIPTGHVNITGYYTCTTENVVYCLTCVPIDRVHWGDWTQDGIPFQGTPQGCDQRQDDLPVPAHCNRPDHSLQDMKVAVLKADLVIYLQTQNSGYKWTKPRLRL